MVDSKIDPNQHWPDQIWIAGEGHAKRRSHPREEGAVKYVRADAYDQLVDWCHVMIVEGEACPCTMPAIIATTQPTPAPNASEE